MYESTDRATSPSAYVSLYLARAQAEALLAFIRDDRRPTSRHRAALIREIEKGLARNA